VNSPIALITDFGLRSPYVGAMKGVIYGIHPQATVIDITHQIAPQDIKEAAFVLGSVFRHMPQGTIFVAVVDPGVGGERKGICLKAGRCYFIGPDNGIFEWVIRRSNRIEVRVLENERYWRKSVSNTFHARDVFGPVAAHLSRRDVFKQLGPLRRSVERLDLQAPFWRKNELIGEVVYVDHFGNATSNIEKREVGSNSAKVFVRTRGELRVVKTFALGRENELIALWNSEALLELAVKDDSAAKRFGIKVGDKIGVRI